MVFNFLIEQKSSKADRQKITDIRQLKDEYEHRLTQAEKASKVEINRLVSVFQLNDYHHYHPQIFNLHHLQSSSGHWKFS